MFSVVIPLFNKEVSIRNTIQSVLDQTFQKFEIVIVNDGSSDNSVKIIEGISDVRIRLIHQKNQGVSAARNKGIEESKYDWIAFLDGDDIWKDNHLSEVKKMMTLYPMEKVFTTSFNYSDNRPMFKHRRNKEIFKIENYFKESIKERLIWTSVAVINKECFNIVGVFNTKYIRGEDLDLWARLAKKYSIVKSQFVTAIYRIEAENRSDKPNSVKKTYLSNIDFDNIIDQDEYNYFKKNVIIQIKGCILNNQWKDLIYLIRKYNYNLLR